MQASMEPAFPGAMRRGPPWVSEAQGFAVDRIADIFGNDKRKSLPLAIDKKLFVAGEATARTNGTCNGAYWSGVRAAREVARVLN